MTKLKQFCEKLNNWKYILPLILVGIVSLLFLAEFVETSVNILLILLCVFTISCLFIDFEKVLFVMLFTLPFWGVGGKIGDVNWHYWLGFCAIFVCGIKYIVNVFLKQKKAHFIIILLSLVVVLLSFVNFNIKNINNILLYVELLCFAYLCFVNFNELNVYKIIKGFLYGLCISLLIGTIMLGFETTKFLVFTKWSHRFQALCYNPNFLSQLLSLALAFVIYMFCKKQINIIQALLFGVIFVSFGIFTMSKTFILTLIILLILILAIFTFRFKKKGLYYSAITIAIVCVLIVVFKDKILEIFDRFTKYNYESIIDKITTGRWSIWKEYLKDWTSSFSNILFGRGVSADGVVSKVDHQHSLYVKIITDFGIVGTLILMLLVFSYIKSNKLRKFSKKLSDYVPLIVCCVISISECLIGKFNVCVVLTLMLIFNKKENVIVSNLEINNSENIDLRKTNNNSIKILHILSSLNASGGIVQVVKNFWDNIDTTKYSFDLAYFTEIEENLSEYFSSRQVGLYKFDKMNLKNYFKVRKQLIEILEKSNCDIVHLHMPILHSVVKSAIKKVNSNGKRTIKLIQHAHASVLSSYFIRRLRSRVMLLGVNNNTDRIFACSQCAGKTFFGRRFLEHGDVIYNSIDLNKFSRVSSTRVCRELNITNRKVYCHIGRICKEKNQKFIIDVFNEISRIEKDSVLILLGNGAISDIDELKNKAKNYGLEDRVIFAGVRKDVNAILKLSHAVIFPSLYEGLGIVLIEAQVSKTLCFASDTCPQESNISNLITYIPLSMSASEWANIILNTEYPSKVKVDTSNYDIKKTIKTLENIYSELVNK